MHALNRLTQAFIREPQQNPTVHQARIHDGPYEKDEDVFRQAIESWLSAREFRGSLGEQKLDRRGKFGKSIQTHDKRLWEGCDKWIQHSNAESDGHTNEFGAPFF